MPIPGRQRAGFEQGESHHRGARPNQECNGENQHIDADAAGILPPSRERMHKARLACFALTRKIVKTDGKHRPTSIKKPMASVEV